MSNEKRTNRNLPAAATTADGLRRKTNDAAALLQ